jgi:hypothetical protein
MNGRIALSWDVGYSRRRNHLVGKDRFEGVEEAKI